MAAAPSAPNSNMDTEQHMYSQTVYGKLLARIPSFPYILYFKFMLY